MTISILEQNKRDDYMQDLAMVTTVNEACKLWFLNRSTVNRWCAEGKIVAIKRGDNATWLISVRSLVDMLGMPKFRDK